MKGKSFIVIGLGRFGANVAKTLAKLNADVMAIDIKQENVQAISSVVTNSIIADSTKLSVLEELGAASVDHAVVAIGNNLQASILTVLNLSKLGVKSITVRADEEGHKEIYSRLGATEVIIPEEESAVSLANQVLSDSILDYYPLSKDYAMVKTSIGPNFVPGTLIELDIRNQFEVNIVGLYRDNKFYVPKGTDKLLPNDVAVVVGTRARINRFDKYVNSRSKKTITSKIIDTIKDVVGNDGEKNNG